MCVRACAWTYVLYETYVRESGKFKNPMCKLKEEEEE